MYNRSYSLLRASLQKQGAPPPRLKFSNSTVQNDKSERILTWLNENERRDVHSNSAVSESLSDQIPIHGVSIPKVKLSNNIVNNDF
jgi:hypothetical protein